MLWNPYRNGFEAGDWIAKQLIIVIKNMININLILNIFHIFALNIYYGRKASIKNPKLHC